MFAVALIQCCLVHDAKKSNECVEEFAGVLFLVFWTSMGYDLYLVAWYFLSWRRKLFHDCSELLLIAFLDVAMHLSWSKWCINLDYEISGHTSFIQSWIPDLYNRNRLSGLTLHLICIVESLRHESNGHNQSTDSLRLTLRHGEWFDASSTYPLSIILQSQ